MIRIEVKVFGNSMRNKSKPKQPNTYIGLGIEPVDDIVIDEVSVEAGTPVVTTNVVITRQTVDNGLLGLTVDGF